MAASKTVDAFGLQKGFIVQQADAEAAYTQTEIKGTPTWVRLPYDRWPEEWKAKKYHDPVVRLKLALYGHPDAGTYREQRADEHLKTT